MIDLHIHTTHSDGTDTIKQVLIKANELDLEVISFTDHNTCIVYEELEKINISKLYKGKIIVGCEFTTSFNNKIIEILGYGFNYKEISKFLNQFYNYEYYKERNIILGNRLINILKSKKININLNNCLIKKDDYSYYGIKKIYNEIINNKDNYLLFEENIFNSYEDFARKGLYNPKSSFYLNYCEFFPSLKEIINLIHNYGGKVFLAHPYQYKFNNLKQFLDKIYKENDIDGIECFYTTFNNSQIMYLLDFAQNKNLLICGGSDYHGTNKRCHMLGLGRGNLNITSNIISDWNIEYYKKRN